MPRPHTVSVSDNPSSTGNGRQSDLHGTLKRKGQLLDSSRKVAVCLVLEEIDDTEKGSAANLINSEGIVKSILDDHARFAQVLLSLSSF